MYFNPLAPCGARRERPSLPSVKASHFNPLAPCGARHALICNEWFRDQFQSTRPVRGETHAVGRADRRLFISIHSPRAGRDQGRDRRRWSRRHFNPLAPCGARLHLHRRRDGSENISIHSPRAGRDVVEIEGEILVSVISIHSPRAGRDDMIYRYQDGGSIKFQSTRPVRGETSTSRARPTGKSDFNPLAPCGARPSAGISSS